jgi:hypothetical protein
MQLAVEAQHRHLIIDIDPFFKDRKHFSDLSFEDGFLYLALAHQIKS